MFKKVDSPIKDKEEQCIALLQQRKKEEKETHNINLIWLGSTMQPRHVERIKQWKKLNPDVPITVYCDEKHQSEITSQLEKIAVAKPVSEIKIPSQVQETITKLVNPKDKTPNYAAASDIYRLYLLKNGGWYVDVDIEPFKLTSKEINKGLGFHLYREHDQYNLKELSPAVIAAYPNSEFIDLAIKITEKMLDEFKKEKILNFVLSDDYYTRKEATIKLTGSIFKIALNKILIDGKPIISNDEKILNLQVFHLLGSEMKSHTERNWLFEGFSEEKQEDALLLSGLKDKLGYIGNQTITSAIRSINLNINVSRQIAADAVQPIVLVFISPEDELDLEEYQKNKNKLTSGPP